MYSRPLTPLLGQSRFRYLALLRIVLGHSVERSEQLFRELKRKGFTEEQHAVHDAALGITVAFKFFWHMNAEHIKLLQRLPTLHPSLGGQWPGALVLNTGLWHWMTPRLGAPDGFCTVLGGFMDQIVRETGARGASNGAGGNGNGNTGSALYWVSTTAIDESRLSADRKDPIKGRQREVYMSNDLIYGMNECARVVTGVGGGNALLQCRNDGGAGSAAAPVSAVTAAGGGGASGGRRWGYIDLFTSAMLRPDMLRGDGFHAGIELADIHVQMILNDICPR